jgi:acyl-CoA ligase (AMP-forming) (exosortase A-associated)
MTTPVRLHDLLELSPGLDLDEALVQNDTAWSYGQLRAQVRAVAGALHRLGLERGQRVAVLLPKCLQECAALFGVSQADGVVVPINHLLKPEQVRHILADSQARVLITAAEPLAGMAPALRDLPDLQILRVDQPLPEITVDQATVCHSIGQDLAAILYTSGSTGSPKGVMLSHSNLVAGTRIVRTYLGIGRTERILSVLPFSFDYGLNQLLTAVEQGAVTVLCAFTLGDQVVRALHQHRITGLAGVPTLWAMLTRGAPSLARTPLPHLRYITNSGGPVPEDTVRRLRSLLPNTALFLMYGLTEAFRSTYLPPSEVDHRPTSIGRAIPECEVFVLTAEGRRAAPGEPGILIHRGPTVSMGYWRRPEDTARVLRPNPLRGADEGADVVCWSGDLVMQDAEGYFYFVGRQDAMIKSVGYRISPSEVEDALMATGAFRQVAAIGLPDEWMGQRLCAVAVPAMENVDLPAVLRAVSERLPAYMVPSRVDLTAALPTTPNGKVDYKALVAERSLPQPVPSQPTAEPA